MFLVATSSCQAPASFLAGTSWHPG